MIKFQNVFFSYSDGDSSIKDITFSIKSGECVVICGKSGSGKSTILRTISGLIPVFYEGELKGKVEIDKQIPAELDSEERANLFGVVFQDPRSQFFMNSVQDEICFAAENIGLSAHEIRQKLDEIVGVVGIEGLLSKNIDELSSGQKQKVALASSLILQPKVLILDEPSSNLDEDGVKVLIKIIKKIKDRGISIIISEHRLEPFNEVVNRFFYIDRGLLRKIWSKEEFESLDNESLSNLGLRPKIINKNTKNKGEVVSLLGNNGAGKTTLCKVISGLLKENGGSIKYRGKVANRNLRNKFCYFVMQDADYQLYSDSVVSEISIGKKITEKLKKDIVDSLDAFSLNELKDRHPASLSGGEKQRVILAAAYCSDADVYILDEPTSGMDGDGLHSIIKWVKLLSEKGKIVVIITHDSLLAEATSDKFLYLEEGKQIKEGKKVLYEYN